ncbi:hypothetical protein PR048_008047 [Dryococelus australis]|uniref:Uncharacterized protein n=1 Tax=Dryococelus australis TaxID=614101 RepID=A0ABQ9HW00_9NEOP|nr:hypothetical protein PR048_008047 [Dryococelus australis]
MTGFNLEKDLGEVLYRYVRNCMLSQGLREPCTGATSVLQFVLNERCDGNRNILHACVAMCTPSSNKEDQEGGSGVKSVEVIASALRSHSDSLQEMMGQATAAAHSVVRTFIPFLPEREIASDNGTHQATTDESIPTISWPPETFDPASGDEDSLMGLGASSTPNTKPAASSSTPTVAGNTTYIVDPVERKNNALQALRLICDCPALQPHLKDLLSAKDAQGQTPFMLAVQCRAYPAAQVVLDSIQRVAQREVPDTSAEQQHRALVASMVYPPGSAPDDSPLHVICCNDTCSFTWTGAEHINQFVRPQSGLTVEELQDDLWIMHG